MNTITLDVDASEVEAGDIITISTKEGFRMLEVVRYADRAGEGPAAWCKSEDGKYELYVGLGYDRRTMPIDSPMVQVTRQVEEES